MDVLSSAEFRKTYASLERPVTVTVNGHPIGQWVPISTAIDSRALDAIRPGEPSSAEPGRAFNSRPFTPVPKAQVVGSRAVPSSRVVAGDDR